jgi:hypothetical protein|tara:strand:+ start:169 stop:474 length:306 start_codon:yes stop_codon:yes gene_type:complete
LNIAGHTTTIITKNQNMTIPYYLMASYAYYIEDDPIFSDDFYDMLSKKILNNWDSIKHYHKHLLDKDMLIAGTYLGEYPNIVIDALSNLRDVHGKKKRKKK